MCPPFGSDETIMAYVMPLGWGHPPHQFTAEFESAPAGDRAEGTDAKLCDLNLCRPELDSRSAIGIAPDRRIHPLVAVGLEPVIRVLGASGSEVAFPWTGSGQTQAHDQLVGVDQQPFGAS